MQAQSVKIGMLSKPNRHPAIVLFGGSNVAFGYDSKIIYDSLHIPVINAGLHASVGLKYMIDDCFPNLKKGDILVFSPEYDHFYGDMAYGQQPMADLAYISNFKIANTFTYKQWISVINNTPKYLRGKIESNVFNILGLETDPVYTKIS